MKKKKQDFVKYIYWLTLEAEMLLAEELQAKNIKIRSAKGVMCTPLDDTNKITVVHPEIWAGHCHRAGAWYRTSDKNGLYLAVSSFELRDYRNQEVAVVRSSDFTPLRSANREEKEKMIRIPEFIGRMPAEWRDVTEKEKKIYLQWAVKLGSDVKEFDDLFLTQSANHANFIRPQFYLERNNWPIPYSIDQSAHLCSSCLEFYDILGGDHKQKLVRPCPGAVFYARLEADRYYLVDKG